MKTKNSIVFLLPFVLLIFFPPPCSPAPLNGLSRDTQQLLSFKAATVLNQIQFQNWVSSTNPCSFTGIKCKGSRVSSIDLTNTMLSIDFSLVSSYLLSLEKLESLVLKNTNLWGSLTSASKSQCGDSLSYIDLAENSISGTVSDIYSLSRCYNLKALNLSSNSMNPPLRGGSGGAVTRLQSLDLSYNNIPGHSIFFMLSPSHFPEIELLSLKGNKLSGHIPELSFKNLSYLDLSANNFLGKFPTFQDCSNLEHLDLSSNKFSGSIGASLSSCSKLSFFDLSNNNLSGELPVETLLNLTSLKTLVFSFNNFVGGLSESMSSLVNLETLDLSSNNISGMIPSGICKDPKNSLKVLYLQNNLFTGPIPESLSNCSQLESLDLSFNYLKGKMPSSLGSLSKLKDLIIWLNELEGEIPWELMYLQYLESLILDFNGLSGPIPECLSNCTSLKWISLSNNLLSGVIPASLGRLPNLAILKLGNNSISGNIPAELGNCRSLLWLNLNTNFLKGSIPPALFKQSGNIEMALLGSKQFVYIMNDGGSEQCHGARNLLEFGGIIHYRLDRNPCNLTRAYKLSSLSTFNHNGSMIFLDLSYNKLEGSIPKELGSMQYLQVLNLRHNDLSGRVPREFGGLEDVGNIDLSHNRLDGSIPQTLTNLTFLSDIDLSNNHLSGMIPNSGQFGTFPEERFANNSGLCGYPLPPCGLESSSCSSSSSKPSRCSGSSSSSKPSKSKKKNDIIIPCAAIAGVAIGLVILLLVYRRGRERTKDNDDDDDEWSMISFQRVEFSKWEILDSLTDENLIGKGGSGKVYRVTTRQGQRVAVKSIRDEQKQGHGLEKQFLAEVKILGGIWHNNIVKLLCCIRGRTTKLIVYEYMEKQCLDKWLHGKKKGLTTQFLNWESRLKIAIGAAQGLCYMHHDCNPPIVHRDIKSSNILVDSEFNAKIADFGLAKMLASQRDPETASAVVGTFGYIAPEYGTTRKVNVKSDVYSLGVVLLELTTGREAVTRDEDMNLAQWAHKHQREGNSAVDALDEEIKDPCYLEAATTVFKLGLACTLSSPSSRPSMKDILQILQRCSENSCLFSQS